MTLGDYLKDKIFIIILNILSMVSLSFYLFELGNGVSEIIIILLVWIIIIIISLTINFYRRKKYLLELLTTCKNLDRRYLIADIMDNPQTYDDSIYHKILKLSNKSMLEKITSVNHERREYKEYIEQWIHEAKTPISAMKLVCENNKSDISRKLLIEVEKCDKFVEQALFYARSENIEKDYLIKEVKLEHIINNSIISNKQLLISNNICVEISCEDTVFTDSKWIEFILNQLIGNSVKYKCKSIKISSKVSRNGVALSIYDDGIGIKESDLHRIFEKGFTGENGRENNKSTGIGLYLCKKLCDKLGLEIIGESKSDEFTKITIFFPKGTFVKIQE